MIAAISPDLGTPVTRLRLRAEFVEGEEQQTKMLADLNDVAKMVGSTLSFACDDAAVEPRVTVDLRTLIECVCNDAVGAGGNVTLLEGVPNLPCACRPGALRRALANLVENAVKYGKRARVALENRDDEIVVTIDDAGPGIPAKLRERAFRPFRGLEASRSRETGGSGLGLTVVRTIILSHGGEIDLADRAEGGFGVEVHLPS